MRKINITTQKGHTMFQSFYDQQNDRFLIAPLRCGSSYTSDMADTLKWVKISHVVSELISESDSDEQQWQICQNPLLEILYLMTSKKYKDSEWVTFVRNPWNRYLSAAGLILSTNFDAPGYVSEDELQVFDDYFKDNPASSPDNGQSAYFYVDKKLVQTQMNSFLYDFTLRDMHLVPCLAAQLTLWVHNPNLKLINLSDMTNFYQENYPPGDVVQKDLYSLIERTKRPDSDVPTRAQLNLYKRFLSFWPEYNDVQAKKKGIPYSFSDFIQYEIDAWDLINSEYFNKSNAVELLVEMMEEPYFFSRNKTLYQFYMSGHKIIESRVLTTALSALPKVQQSVIDSSWLNLSLKQSWNQ